VAVLLWPYLPASSERLLASLGAEALALDGAGFASGNVHRTAPPEVLFPKELGPA
jgi:methionyl-tRNA synthetase